MAINPVGGMPMPGGTQGAQGSPSSELQRLEKRIQALKQQGGGEDCSCVY